MKKTASNTAKKTTKVSNAKSTFKLTAKRMKQMQAMLGMSADEAEEEVEGEGSEGKIQSILNLFAKGCTRKEIVAFGFNKSTVYRQTRELTKRQKAPDMQYFGHNLYEARLQRAMKAKGLNREKAAQFLADKDAKETFE